MHRWNFELCIQSFTIFFIYNLPLLIFGAKIQIVYFLARKSQNYKKMEFLRVIFKHCDLVGKIRLIENQSITFSGPCPGVPCGLVLLNGFIQLHE